MTKTATKKVNKKLSELLLSKEIAGGITSEKLSAMFFDSTKIKHQPEILYRLDSKDNRNYYRFDEKGEPVFYTSVTTMIKNTLPTSPYLIKWLIEKGGDEGKDEAEERAHYGTFLHTEAGSLLVNGTYDLDKLKERLQIYLSANNIPPDRIKWADELKKDILAFAQFMIDTDCKPLAIEICLWHPTDGYAGAIDIVCEFNIEEKGFFGDTYLSGVNKGQPKESKQTKRIRAIIDIKSGRKGFYESHEIQLAAYKEMWNIHFPDYLIDKTLNWSPKDWKNVPSYNLKDQTDSRNILKLPYLVSLAKIEAAKRDNTVTLISGHIDLTKGLKDNIEELTLVQLVKKNK
jgi:hypothetical protein